MVTSAKNWTPIGITAALKDFPFAKSTVYAWCFEACPLLGRTLRHKSATLGRRKMLRVCREDLEQCRTLRENPFGQMLPGNAGVWLSSGLYKGPDPETEDAEALWCTAAYLKSVHKIDKLMTRYWCQHGHRALDPTVNGGKLRSQKVRQAAARANPWGAMTQVHPMREVERIIAYRQAQPGRSLPGQQGVWIDAAIYNDAAGVWVTNKWLQATYKVSDIFAGYWHRKGKLRRQRVAQPHDSKGLGRATVFVYHQAEAMACKDGALLPAAAACTARTSPRGKGGRKRSTEVSAVYCFCHQQYTSTTVKLASIRMAAEKRFGPRAPKEASHVTEYARRHATRMNLATPTRPAAHTSN